MKISHSAGHSKTTPGKQSPDGMKEWEFNSAVVGYAMALLNEYKDVEQLRVDDPTGNRDISLKERSDKVNNWGADVHIDYHANAFGAGGYNAARGIETYVYKTKPKEAYELAARIQNNLLRATGLPNRGVKAADFHMLRETNMTSVLPEMGFMTNQDDLRLLKSDHYRRSCAEAIVAALVEQYKLVKKPAPKKPETAAKDLWGVQVFAGSKEGAEKALHRAKTLFPDAYMYKK
ncbi:N-acetylmuramoyl-L-alanine amidase [Mesobacillus subterraneus]|jgi:N-acetylmuramoyl-L-alanine amidase|uniref:N-acetylmuramoyl-L-alanine amidase n=1 Tax=Mesobacillus subterraneus TaxID=285983 RepID=UPI00203A7BD9|nr:N-acetylmuramoyl-L-alanine amidase [Mesobacillus subterraneus]MCM3665499.1 N-acetylmuramoyl-L-alanine amidase [Mesobacillus subterraneus]MCM3686058.1 N-acetylmuramoyl-L-alanine amidase [Mesobacillus subterraneus]